MLEEKKKRKTQHLGEKTQHDKTHTFVDKDQTQIVTRRVFLVDFTEGRG